MADSTHLNLGELSRTITALKKMEKDDAMALGEATEECCKIIGAKAVEYAPIETGELRESMTIEVVGKGSATKGFITFTAPHALPVHEDMEARHAEGTGAKFLERAARESATACGRITKRKMEHR